MNDVPKPFRHIPMSISELEAEREWALYCEENKTKGDGTDKKAFMAGLRSSLIAGTSRREKFEHERFRRAFTLAHQLHTIIGQCLTLLDNIRKRTGIVGPGGVVPADPLNIGKTIETVLVAMKHGQAALKLLDGVKIDAP